MNVKTINYYGCPVRFSESEFTPTELQFKYNRWAFANYFGAATGVPPRAYLFRALADFWVPGWFEWHVWTERIVDTLCRRRWVAIPGCSGSAKTRNVAGYCCVWWLAAPEISSVIFCSTTMKMLRKRGWSEVQNFYNAYTARWGEFGNMVDSRTVWQCTQGDDLHAIFAIAVQDGDSNKVAANIQGMHSKRQFVGIDEAEAVPTAIWKSSSNLYAYPVDSGGEFTLCAIANPRSRLSQFGRYIEPEGGWDSVSVETDEWESKPQLDGKKAMVVRLDFAKSPNYLADKAVSKHLPTKARVKNRMDALRAKGAENDPDHWCYDRGFPAPDGLSQTVFTDTLITNAGGYGQHVFNGDNFTIIGAFDQAFGGGDRPALRFAAMGDIKPGVVGIEWMPPIELYVDAKSTLPARFQLKDQLKKHCAAVQYRGQIHECQKRNLAIDVTGEGGLADICDQDELWPGGTIIRIMFSGACSTEPCSHEDERPANEVYLNKRVEMHFRAKNATLSGQLKGIDKDTASELCTLEYKEVNDTGKRILITMQSKKEYKSKFTKSPDYSDCGIMTVEVARLRGFRIIETGSTVARAEEFHKVADKANAVYHDVNYGEEEEGMYEMDEAI